MIRNKQYGIETQQNYRDVRLEDRSDGSDDEKMEYGFLLMSLAENDYPVELTKHSHEEFSTEHQW